MSQARDSAISCAPGDIIPYMQMCQDWSSSLQRGMNFRLKGGKSLVLMSRRKNAPYRDRIEDEGKTLIYEGHDRPRMLNGPDPKTQDQPGVDSAEPTWQNALFFKAAKEFKEGKHVAEEVYVYEKIHTGVWAYNGVFQLVDAYQEFDGARRVLKFKLVLSEPSEEALKKRITELEHNRLIPSAVKVEVWKRDKGRCTVCQSTDNLHFDHIIPFSKGGSSLTSKNIQLMCARHNLQKHNSIE